MNDLPKRKDLRLTNCDYSEPSAYFITICTKEKRKTPLQSRSLISQIVGFIKANSSKEIHKINPDLDVWQRGFYDHIIRDKCDYEEISKYIYENPLKWEFDELYCEE